MLISIINVYRYFRPLRELQNYVYSQFKQQELWGGLLLRESAWSVHPQLPDILSTNYPCSLLCSCFTFHWHVQLKIEDVALTL